MFVIKRDGEKQAVSFDKITTRITTLCKGLASQVDPVVISQKVNLHGVRIRGRRLTPSSLAWLSFPPSLSLSQTRIHMYILIYRLWRVCTRA